MSPPAPAAASLALPSSPSADPSSASPSLAPSASAAPPPPGADTPACGLPAPLPGLLRSLCDAWDGGSSSSPCELPPPLAARAPDLARMGENSALYRDEGDATSPALMRPDVSREVAGVGCDASDVRSPDVLAEPLASATPMCDAPPPVERELDDITSDRRWRYRASCFRPRATIFFRSCCVLRELSVSTDITELWSMVPGWLWHCPRLRATPSDCA